MKTLSKACRNCFQLLGLCLGVLSPVAIPNTYADDGRLYRSPAYLGRGDTGIATADYHEAIFYNPAGLASGTGLYKETVLASPMIEVSTSTRDLVREVVLEKNTDTEKLRNYIGKNQHVATQNFSGIVFRRAALGAYARAETNALVYKSPIEGGLEEVSAEGLGHQAICFSLAESFFGGAFLMGITGKYLHKQSASLAFGVLDAKNITSEFKKDEVLRMGYGGGADLGFMLKDEGKTPYSYGLHIENVGDSQFTSLKKLKAPKALKQTVNLGFAAEPGTKVSRIGLLFDYRDITNSYGNNPYKKAHFGISLKLKKFLELNAGINQGYLTTGLGLNLYVLRIDIGTYTEEVGTYAGARPDTRAYFRLQAGF